MSNHRDRKLQKNLSNVLNWTCNFYTSVEMMKVREYIEKWTLSVILYGSLLTCWIADMICRISTCRIPVEWFHTGEYSQRTHSMSNINMLTIIKCRLICWMDNTNGITNSEGSLITSTYEAMIHKLWFNKPCTKYCTLSPSFMHEAKKDHDWVISKHP